MKLTSSEAGGQHVDLESNGTAIRRIIGVTLAFLLLSLVVVSIAKYESENVLFGGSLIRYQADRDRIASLSRIATLLWLVALVLIPSGMWCCRRDSWAPRTLQRILFAGMIASPVVWLVNSIWLIREIQDVVY